MKAAGAVYNDVCGDMEPRMVLHYFEEICKIPHGSFHIEAISDYIAGFARARGLRYIQDEAGNVIIFKKGSPGKSANEPIILQGHMDMVLEQTEDCPLDLVKDHIILQRDNDVLYAKGTTLGGDDGIAIAIMLALLDDDTLVHPPLECIFTVNEEVGLLGANVLDVSELRAHRMINIDSEEEGIFTVSCAGGTEEHICFMVERKARFGTELEISVSGLMGGHSGICIDKGRANADILLGRILHTLYERVPFRLISIEGGTKDNAIPRNARARLLFESGFGRELVEKTVKKTLYHVRSEYAATDPGIQCEIEWSVGGELASDPMSKKDTKRILRFLMLTPNGLIETDGTDHTMPQTSLNLGILTSDTHKVEMVYLIRSSINSQKDLLTKKVELLAKVLGAQTHTQGSYPAWEKVNNSAFVQKLCDIYEKENGKKPVLAVVHGGVECGVLASKMDGLDCVSIGPDLVGIHTPDEKLSISSTKRLWDFLISVLKEF